MNASGVFVAVLLHEDFDRDYAVELPRNENFPPRRLLIPRTVQEVTGARIGGK